MGNRKGLMVGLLLIVAFCAVIAVIAPSIDEAEKKVRERSRLAENQRLEEVAAWRVHRYRIFRERDFSAANRTREGIWVAAPTATKPERQVATAVKAAAERYRKTGFQEITVWLYLEDDDQSLPEAQVVYTPDGCYEGKCDGIDWRVESGDMIPPDWFLKEYSPHLQPKRRKQTAQQLQSQQLRCEQDLQCWGKKHHVDATVACRPVIENAAQFDFKWDSFLKPKLDRWLWENRREGTLRFHGNAVKFQNAYGAWYRVEYWVLYDPRDNSCELTFIQ